MIKQELRNLSKFQTTTTINDDDNTDNENKNNNKTTVAYVSHTLDELEGVEERIRFAVDCACTDSCVGEKTLRDFEKIFGRCKVQNSKSIIVSQGEQVYYRVCEFVIQRCLFGFKSYPRLRLRFLLELTTCKIQIACSVGD